MPREVREEWGVFICGMCGRRPSFSSALSTVMLQIVVSYTLATGTPHLTTPGQGPDSGVVIGIELTAIFGEYKKTFNERQKSR